MKIDGADWKAGILMLKTSDPEAIRFAASFKQGNYELAPRKERRSKDSNAYLWTMCNEIADKLFGETKEDVYRRAIKRCGIYKDFCLTEDEARTFRVAWERIGTGWITERVDYDKDGDRVIVRAYYGSSTYNQRQMSRIIDDVVQDAKALGIETLTDREISRLMEDWGAKHGQ